MKNFKKLFQAKKKETIINRLFNTINKTASNDNRKFSTRVKELEELEKTLKRSRKISKEDKKPLYNEIKKQSKHIEKRKDTYKNIIEKKQKDIKGVLKTTTETKKGFKEFIAKTKVIKNLTDLKQDTKHPEINIKSLGKSKRITVDTNLKGNGIKSFNMKDRDFIAMNNEINKGTKESYEKGLKILNTAFNKSIKELEKYEQQVKGNENLRITEVLYYQQAFERSY